PLVLLLLQQYTKKRGVFPFFMIWSLYMATSGQATPSAFGHYRAAGTEWEANLIYTRLAGKL
ncbi:hypothetical protein, partial [Desulfoscipio gibsoniae]